MKTYIFRRWMHSTRYMDERVVTSEKWWSGIEEKMLETKRSELNELIENLTCLNALEGEFWKSDPKVVTDEKSWKTWKSNQNSVMNEKLVQNIVMNENKVQNIVMYEELVQNSVMNGQFVKNFVMNAQIDPKVVMDLSILKIGGWNSLQPINQNLLEDFLMRMNRGC